MSVDIAKVSPTRQAAVFAVANAYLAALIEGEPEKEDQAFKEWERLLKKSDSEASDDE